MAKSSNPPAAAPASATTQAGPPPQAAAPATQAVAPPAAVPPQAQPPAVPGVAVVEMTSLYKVFIIINAVVCGLCFVAMLILAFASTKESTEQMRSASNTVETVFKMSRIVS